MRILYILPSIDKPSGWRTLSVNAINALSNIVEPHLVLSSHDYGFAKELLPSIPKTSIPTTQKEYFHGKLSPFKFAYSICIAKIKSYPTVDLVHSLETYPTGLLGQVIADKLKVPHVMTAIGTYSVLPYKHVGDRIAYSSVLRRVSAIYPISSGTGKILMQNLSKQGLTQLDIARIKTVLIGNNYYLHTKPKSRKKTGTPIILSVGEIKPRKGYHLSIRAFGLAQQIFPEAQYRIIGSVPPKFQSYFDELQDIVKSENIKNVEFLGRVTVEQLSDHYHQASIFMLTPQMDADNFEGFGLVYLEAGAFELPVVGTRVGGVPDVVVDGETGYLEKQDDFVAIARRLRQLLADQNLRQSMGKANRKRSETLTWKRYAEEQYLEYRHLLER